MLAEDRSEGILGILSLSLANVCSSVELTSAESVVRNDKTRRAVSRRDNKSRIRFLRWYYFEIIGSLSLNSKSAINYPELSLSVGRPNINA